MAAHDALRTILPVAGLSEDRARTVEITGGSDPVLPTPFRIGETAAAALAATGLAVSDLWELRTGRPQEVAVDLRHATASLRSGNYLQVNGVKVRGERNEVMGMYPAKNGRWSYVHANFPNHRAAALKVLGCEESKASVRKAVAGWDALELEEAIIAAGGAGGMVRSMAEWAQHPQAAAIASLPLLEIVKIGGEPGRIIVTDQKVEAGRATDGGTDGTGGRGDGGAARSRAAGVRVAPSPRRPVPPSPRAAASSRAR